MDDAAAEQKASDSIKRAVAVTKVFKATTAILEVFVVVVVQRYKDEGASDQKDQSLICVGCVEASGLWAVGVELLSSKGKALSSGFRNLEGKLLDTSLVDMGSLMSARVVLTIVGLESAGTIA